MKYPKINKQPRRMVSVPSLQGGMNLRDALNMCQDNQLTDSLNMWFKDGILKTRPGINEICDFKGTVNYPIVYSEDFCELRKHENIIKTDSQGKLFKLLTLKTDYNNRITTGLVYSEGFNINFFWSGESKIEELPAINLIDTVEEIKKRDNLNYFVIQSTGKLYCFMKNSINNEFDENGESVKEYLIYVLENDSEDWRRLSEEEIYAPLVMTNCKTNGGGGANQETLVQLGGVLYEGFNLLGNRYRMVYSTVNKDKLIDNVTNHWMMYPLLYNAYNFIGQKITVKHTNSSGTYTHTLTLKNKSGDIEETAQGGLKLGVWGNGEFICFFKGDTTKETMTDANNRATVTENDYIENNLEITAPCPNNAENMNKIFNMTRTEWFGGASEGINGGTRLFLGGNTQEAEQSLIVWSDLNNPLYFPENCYSYVGNSMSAVTAFGKQEDMLVIFKENELYYTKYNQNTGITAENLINQSIVDYAASSAHFPLVQINPVIGCSCPDTVQLCRNRLVWTNNDGKVYTLTGASQYSERNVFCVSEMIERKLKNDDRFKYALDFDGYYMLIASNGYYPDRIYLMDYNSYGYQYVYSYQKTEDANIKTPWYCWEIDLGYTENIFYTINNKLLCFKHGSSREFNEMYLYDFNSDTDNGEPISCMAQTKFFDFGSPNYRKNIDAVGISFGNNGGEPITVKYITESGEDSTTVTLCDDETDVRNAGFITSRILYPSIRSAVRFGVKFICEGNMAIEGLNITYRTLGGAR